METLKSRERRLREGWFEKYAPQHLSGIDIGCGKDPLNHTFRRYDRIFGDIDAQHMSEVPSGLFHTVYASHVLEHVYDPGVALENWYRLLVPGGNLIVCVPHRDLYEKRTVLPSRWNADHKTFWLPERHELPVTRGLRQTIQEALPAAELVYLRILDEGYQVNGDDHAIGEFSIEAVIRKPIVEKFCAD